MDNFEEFIVNDYIKLKLEKNKTIIYILDDRFSTCKFLLLDIPVNDISSFDDVQSIDEAADLLGWTINGQQGVEYQIDPKTEFWGHCSNLQAWYEHNYDTRLLHSNLAFGLLKKLSEVGDFLARKVLKEEIIKRFKSGYPTTLWYIFEEKLLELFDQEEKEELFQDTSFLELIIKQMEYYADNYKALYNLIEAIITTQWNSEKFQEFLKEEEFSYNYEWSYDIVFCKLLEMEKDKDWTEQHFSILVESINRLDFNFKSKAFYKLLEISKEKGTTERYFPIFIKVLTELLYSEQYYAFSNILKIANDEGWIDKFFLTFLETTENIRSNSDNAKFELIDAIKETPVLEKYYSLIEPKFLLLMNSIRRNRQTHYHFYELITSISKTKLFSNNISSIKQQFLSCLENIDEMSWKVGAYNDLFKLANGVGWLEEYIHNFVKALDKLENHHRYNAFSDLLNAVKEKKLVEMNFLFLLKATDKLPHINEYRAFYDLCSSIDDTSNYTSQIKMKFVNLLEQISKLHRDDTTVFFLMLKLVKEKGWIELYFHNLLESVHAVHSWYRNEAFSDLINSVRNTELFIENHSKIIQALDKFPDIAKNKLIKDLKL